MLSGQTQCAVGFYNHIQDLPVLGKPTESIVQLVLVPGEAKSVSTKMICTIKRPATCHLD